MWVFFTAMVMVASVCDKRRTYAVHDGFAEVKDTLHIYGQNALVHGHNISCLQDLHKEIITYTSIDSGHSKLFNAYTCPKYLELCEGAPVIITANIQHSPLFNGTKGIVTKVEEDGPTIRVKGKSYKIKIKHFTFHSQKDNKDIESRILHHPLILGFACTVHQSQGLSLDSVTVHCVDMNHPGQVGVAVGRVKSLEGLDVKNFDKNKCPHHPAIMFMAQPAKPVRDDCKCCANASIFYVATAPSFTNIFI